jgi:hypothetical protein
MFPEVAAALRLGPKITWPRAEPGASAARCRDQRPSFGALIMALAFYETAPTNAAETTLPPDEAEHVRTYRKFVLYMRIAACAVPLLMAFVLYWTT